MGRRPARHVVSPTNELNGEIMASGPPGARLSSGTAATAHGEFTVPITATMSGFRPVGAGVRRAFRFVEEAGSGDGVVARLVRDLESRGAEASLAQDERDRLRHLRGAAACSPLQWEVGDDEDVGISLSREHALARRGRQRPDPGDGDRRGLGICDERDPEGAAVNGDRPRDAVQIERPLDRRGLDPDLDDGAGERVRDPEQYVPFHLRRRVPALLWVANPLAGTVVQVGIESAAVERTLDLDGIPRSIAVDGGTLWVALVARSRGLGDRRRRDPAVAGLDVRGRARGRGRFRRPHRLRPPTAGGTRGSATQMAQAIAFVLRERGFRAARFKVAYQSCDDSVARTGLFDEAKCAANARAYGRNPDIVAVIGTVNSPCAVAAVPELNRAPGGPLAMISPFNSFVGLTRAGPGVDPSLPAALYPTGRRNYVRVYPTDDLQGAALALVARDRGHRRVHVLDDGDPGYGSLMATGFETAARLASASRSPTATRGTHGHTAMRSSLAGLHVPRCRPCSSAACSTPTRAGWSATCALASARRSTSSLPTGSRRWRSCHAAPEAPARGVYVSLAGTVTERLPPAGADFARRFARTQAGGDVEPSAVYAAEAPGALLDAIGRSDCFPDSVLEQLFATRAHRGLLGTFGFDANGDITESPVTILRVTRGGRSSRVGSTEGGVVDRIVATVAEPCRDREPDGLTHRPGAPSSTDRCRRLGTPRPWSTTP